MLHAREPLAEVRAEPRTSRPARDAELHAAGHDQPSGSQDRAERGAEAEAAGGKDQPRREAEELAKEDEAEEDARTVPAESRDRLLHAARRQLHPEATADHVAERQE